jgi:hypothetical protein
MDRRDLAVAVSRGRIALGVAAALAPGLVGRAMVGRDGSRGTTKLFARMLGGRDIALGLGVVIAIDRGAPVRGWLEACALVDGVDLAACLVARDHLPQSAFPATVALAGGSALLCTWLSRQLDPPPPADPGHPEAIATGHPPERVSPTAEATGSGPGG